VFLMPFPVGPFLNERQWSGTVRKLVDVTSETFHDNILYIPYILCIFLVFGPG
jgi:hypothetical protein